MVVVTKKSYGEGLRLTIYKRKRTGTMFWNWLKRILGIPSTSTPTNDSAGGKKSMPKTPYERLDERKKAAKEEKDQIKTFSIEWYRLDKPKSEETKLVEIFQPYQMAETLNLNTLKKERLKKEAHELKLLEENVKSLLTSTERAINGRRADEAKNTFSKILDKMAKVKDSSIRQKHQELQIKYANLVAELEREELAKLAEEKRRQEAEEKKQKEVEEKARREKEKQESKERKRREAEARRLADDALKKELAEQSERKRLLSLSTELKEDWQSFKQVLDENRVKYLYHFTDVRNIPSIKNHGGLLSWYYCHTHGITIPCQGGDYDSRELDKKYGLEDYVRLSFCDDHPMKWRLEQSGSIMKVLRIKVDVALLKDTQFSDMNAADKRHTHGKTLEHLQRVDFDATRMHYLKSEDPNFKPHQAEVMVKTFIPLKYIENI